MDSDGVRYYNIPHYDRYYINKSGVILVKKSLKRAPIVRFSKKHGPYVQITDNEENQSRVPVADILMNTFYGRTGFDIIPKIPYTEDMEKWMTVADLKYDNSVIEYHINNTNEQEFNINGYLWKPVKIMDHLILINTDGCAYSPEHHKFLIRTFGSDNEYSRITIPGTDRGANTHRIIGAVFLPNFAPELVINHKDAHKYNSYLSNLEAITNQENIIHACNMGLLRGQAFNENQIDEILKLIAKGKSYEYILEKLPFLEGYSMTSFKRLMYRIVNDGQWAEVASKYDLSKYKDCGQQYNTVYSEKDIHKVCKLLEKGLSNIEISNKTDIPRDTIQSIRCGKQWTNIASQYDINYTQEKFNTSKDLIEKIYDTAKSGKFHSVREIAEYVNAPYNDVRIALYNSDWNKKYNFDYKNSELFMDHNFMSDDEAHLVCQMIKDGYSDSEISDKVHRSQQSISAIRQGKFKKDISAQYGIPCDALYKSPNPRNLDPNIKNILIEYVSKYSQLSNPEIRDKIVYDHPEVKDDIKTFRIRNYRQICA